MKDAAQTGWETKTLGEVCTFIGGGTPSKQNPAFWGGNFPWVSPKDMKSGVVSDSIDHVTESAIDQSAAKRIPEGSLLIVVRSGILARTIPIAIAGRELTVNQDLKAIVPDKGLDRHFLAYFLRSAEGQLLDRVTRGATVHKLDMPVIKSLPIPLPSLEEQQRIVAVLDQAFEGLARARAHAEANLQNARELFAGTISAEFSKIDSSENRRVGDVAVHSLGKMLDKNKNKGTLRPYLRNLNVRWFTIDTSDLLEMRITDAEVERYTVKKGDLLICEGGYPGRSSIWEQDEEIFFQKALHRVRFEDEAYSRLLMYYLFLSHQSGALQEHCSGAGIQHFTGQSLANFEMPFPTLDVAKRIISTIEEMQRSSTELEGHFQQKLEDLDDLRQSLLQKAFTGELT